MSVARSFSSHKALSDGLDLCGLLVDYCDVFISGLDSHSDGTHSLQGIQWRNAKFLQICSEVVTNSSTPWMVGEYIFINHNIQFQVYLILDYDATYCKQIFQQPQFEFQFLWLIFTWDLFTGNHTMGSCTITSCFPWTSWGFHDERGKVYLSRSGAEEHADPTGGAVLPFVWSGGHTGQWTSWRHAW